ncbi:MAG: hypothetical protein JNL98_44425, partial [Bryobacterales bacterium]|nr:hypothetical protein [Bryobacterales bacterium]
GPAASSPSTPVANVAAAASAPLVDGDEPPPSADLPPQGTAVAARDRPVDVDPRWGRFELPILKRHVDDDSRREARARAAARQAEAAAGPRPPAAIVADAWRAGYAPAMGRVRRGDLPWMTIDALHRMILDEIAGDFGLGGLTEIERQHLNHAWHRLPPWPDSVEGLARLTRRFILT